MVSFFFYIYKCLLLTNKDTKLEKEVIIEHLKEDHPEGLRQVYLEHRNAFLQFAKKYPIEPATAEDVYQDAIIILRDNARRGKLDHLRSELRTYLFGIGKYLIYAHLRKQKKIHLVEDFSDMYQEHTLMTAIITESISERQTHVKTVLEQMGAKCREILSLFYYRGFTIEEITDKLNYNNKDVTKSAKSRCLQSLKQKLKLMPYG